MAYSSGILLFIFRGLAALLPLVLCPTAGARGPAQEILSRIGELPFPALKDGRYGGEDSSGGRSAHPVGFFAWDARGYSSCLEFPLIAQMLKDGKIPEYASVSWSRSRRSIPPESDRYLARSLSNDVARIADCMASAKVSLEAPPEAFTILCLSLIYYAHGCGEIGCPEERDEVLDAVSRWLEGPHGAAVVALFDQDCAQVLFDDAVFFLGEKDSSRVEAARRFALVAKKYPKLEKGILSAKFVKLLEEALREQAADPILSGPEPSDPAAKARWRVHRLQDQCSEGYMTMNCFTGPLFLSGDSPLAKVVDLGVSAIPALLELEGRERLARWHAPQDYDRAGAVGTVQEMVPEALYRITGLKLDFDGARKYWEEMQRNGLVQTLATEVAAGNGVRHARYLASLDASLAVRSLMQATVNSPNDETLLSELHMTLDFDPDLEMIGMARQMLGSPPGTIPWCSGVHVLAQTADRTAVLEAAARGWRQPLSVNNRREVRSLARVLIWNGAFDVITASLNRLPPDRKLALLEAAGSLNDRHCEFFGGRVLPSVETEQRLLRILEQLSGDRTPVPACGKEPYGLRYVSFDVKTNTTFEELSRSMHQGLQKARAEPGEW